MDLNERIPFDKIKVSRLGWTNILTKTANGSFKTVVVKKNLFSGYTLFINNEKKKIKDLYEMGTLDNCIEFVNSRNIGFASKSTLEVLTSAVNTTNEYQQQRVEALSDKNYSLNEQIKKEEIRHNQEINQIEKEHEYEAFNEIKSRINFLKNSFENVAVVSWTEEGTDITYGRANALQISKGRTIGDIIREPYRHEGSFKTDIEGYLTMLNDSLSQQEDRENAKNLLYSYQKISSNIKKLESNYTLELYVKTVSLIADFVKEYKALLINLKGKYKTTDLNFYKTSSNYGTNDEKINDTRSSSGLLKSGIENCKNMISKFESEEARQNFEATIEEVSKQQDLNNLEDEVVEEQAKTM